MGILRDFQLESYECSVYVETGTGAAQTLSKAYPHFEKCYSVDMDAIMVSKARKLLPNAIVDLDLSVNALERWLKNELDPNVSVLFFLDAHFPGADYHNMPYDITVPNAVPLEEELRLIKKYRPDSKDVIICDDARIYVLAPYERGNTPHLLVPGGDQFVKELFPNDQITLGLAEEGYIIIDRRN